MINFCTFMKFINVIRGCSTHLMIFTPGTAFRSGHSLNLHAATPARLLIRCKLGALFAPRRRNTGLKGVAIFDQQPPSPPPLLLHPFELCGFDAPIALVSCLPRLALFFQVSHPGVPPMRTCIYLCVLARRRPFACVSV